MNEKYQHFCRPQRDLFMLCAFRLRSGFRQPISIVFIFCSTYLNFYTAKRSNPDASIEEWKYILSCSGFAFLPDLSSKKHLQESAQQLFRQCSSTPTWKQTSEGAVEKEWRSFTAVKSPCKAAEFSHDSIDHDHESCGSINNIKGSARLLLLGV